MAPNLVFGGNQLGPVWPERPAADELLFRERRATKVPDGMCCGYCVMQRWGKRCNVEAISPEQAHE